MTAQVLWAVKDPSGPFISVGQTEEEAWDAAEQTFGSYEDEMIDEGYRLVRVEVREVGDE